jgi:hypothetical protein
MRGNLKFFALALLLCAFTSCSKEVNTNPEPVVDASPKSYTILYYNCCSGLDAAVEPFFDHVGELNIPEHINVVGQVKWTYGYKSSYSDGSGGVQRFVFNHEENKTQRIHFADINYRVDDPQNFAEFITWAREIAPADEYIMVFCGHGNAYHPAFDDVTRGILRDDQFTSYLGIGDICEAFDIANVAENKFALTMMVCCLMNTLEYATELVPYTDYYLASGHVTAATSGELYLLVDGLIKHGQDEDAIVNATKYAVDADYEAFYSQVEHSVDIALTKSSRIKKLNSKIADFVDRMCALYVEQGYTGEGPMMDTHGFTTKEMDAALAASYYYLQPYMGEGSVEQYEWYRRSYSFDIVDIARSVAEATNDTRLELYAREIQEAAEDAILYYNSSNLSVDRVYYAVTLVNSNQWEELGFEDANYYGLAFDKATGWSELLKINNAKFVHDVE